MPAPVLERAVVLTGDAHYDVCSRVGRGAPAARPPTSLPAGTSPRRSHSSANDLRRHITTAHHPKSGRIKLLRTLQTNACANDCFYCPFRAGRDFRREAFEPHELARLVDQMQRAGMIDGLFLSSGVVGGGDRSMERIAATAEILRQRHGYTGYMHLKIMPRASDAAIEQILRVADRVSINLEAPTTEHLARLTSTKDLPADLLAPLRRAREIALATGSRVGIATQFVVGAAGETDADILRLSARLYREIDLTRIFYSAFTPAPDTPLDALPAENPLRAHRLYQADFMLRRYGATLGDLPFDREGRLPIAVDPKLAWAQAHPGAFPVEINTAGRSVLLRVPGLGPVTVDALLRARRGGRLRHVTDLRRLGSGTARSLSWITIDGHAPPVQLPLPDPSAGVTG